MTLREHCEEMRLIDEVLGGDGYRGNPESARPALLLVEERGRPRATAPGGER